MQYIDVRRKLLNEEQKTRYAKLESLWPVVRVSVERLVLSETLGTSTSSASGSHYFNSLTLSKITRLLSISLKSRSINEDGQFRFALPERLADRSEGSWNPYFGWLYQAKPNKVKTEIVVGAANGLREPLILVAVGFFSAILSVFRSASTVRQIYKLLCNIASNRSMSWRLKGTVKVALRVLWFGVLVDRFRKQIQLSEKDVLFATACKDVAMMALVSVYNEAGAKVVEVQHGLFYEGDYGYAPWGRFAQSSSLPRYYLTWNSADADYVSKAFRIERSRVFEVGLITARPDTPIVRVKGSHQSSEVLKPCLLVMQPSQFMSHQELAKITAKIIDAGFCLDIRVHPDCRDSIYLREFLDTLGPDIVSRSRVIESHEI